MSLRKSSNRINKLLIKKLRNIWIKQNQIKKKAFRTTFTNFGKKMLSNVICESNLVSSLIKLIYTYKYTVYTFYNKKKQ